MNVLIDPTKCSGYGTCAERCPSVFRMDEFGFAATLNSGLVPDGDESRARSAAEACPENAITVRG